MNRKHSEETKSYLTPYAFGVNEKLLGKALASPGKRAWAMVIDLIVIAVLSILSLSTFAGVAACACAYAAFTTRKQTDDPAVSATGLWVAALSLLVLAYVLGQWNINLSSGGEAIASTELGFWEWLDAKGIEFGMSLGWAALYFTFCTAFIHGQTLGKILCGTRVIKIDGSRISLWQSFERYGGYSAGLATGLLGFLQVYWDANRQSIHDKIAETVVLDLRKPDRHTV